MSLPRLPLLLILLELIFVRVGVELLLPQLKLPLPFLVEMLELLLLHLVVPQLHIYGHGLDVRWMLYNLLVLLQDLLELSVLLHYSLVLEANSMLLVLLPVCGCSLQLLQPGIFFRVLRLGLLRWERRCCVFISGW